MLGTHPLRRLLAGALAIASVGCSVDRLPLDPSAASPPAHTTDSAPYAFEARGGCDRDAATPAPPVQSRWCLQLAAESDVEDLLEDHELNLVKYQADARLALVGAPSDIEALREDPRVLYAEANHPVAIDDPLDMLMGFHQGDWDPSGVLTQELLASLQLPELHTLATGAGIKIAILDTGADASHPHLAGHILNAGKFHGLAEDESPNGRDDDGDGDVDEAFGHGTHLAGLLTTLAPGAQILPLGVLNDDGVGTEFDLAVGLRLARLWGAQVVNLSLRMAAPSPIVADGLAELRASGAVILVSAGNEPGAPLPYPASDPSVVPVAATDLGDLLAPFSTSTGALLAAPGVRLESCYPTNRWAWASGTSMACAVAAGSLATVASVQGPASVGRALLALQQRAVPVENSPDLLGGRVAPLAAAQAMCLPRSALPAPTTPQPTAMNGAQL